MGGLAGVAAGFFGGWTDRIVGRIADTIMAFPLFVLAMGIVAALGNTVQNIILATAIVNFPLYARVARAERNDLVLANVLPRLLDARTWSGDALEDTVLELVGVLGRNVFTGAGHSLDAANPAAEQFRSPGMARALWITLSYTPRSIPTR